MDLVMDNRCPMQTVESLCARYVLDLAHARYVAAAAMQLFDETQNLGLHAFTPREREWLQAGATLLDLGMSLDPSNHHLTGRDLVLAAPLQGFSPAERAIVACIVGFHDGVAQPEREPLLKALDDQQRKVALGLAALARVADGLDATRTQSTVINAFARAADGTLVVRICGPHSHDDARQAEARADLWRAVFGAVTFTGRLTSPGLVADDPLAEACRKALRYRVDWAGGPGAWRTASSEPAAPDRVRKLRVAARRMRNDLRIFGPGLRAKSLHPISKGLRDLLKVLRQVRTCDVLLANLGDYIERCDDEDRIGLASLMDFWLAERARRAEALFTFMSSDSYQGWLDALTVFISNEGERVARAVEAGRPSHVRHIIQPTIARQLAVVRSYDVLPDLPDVEQIHALRVAIRRMRYTIEAMQDVLPAEESRAYLAACIAAQEAYGAIHDAHEAAHQAVRVMSLNRADRMRDAFRAVHMGRKGITAYADAQRRVVAARLVGWRDYLEPFL
jgi:CHAD domain-containing protein